MAQQIREMNAFSIYLKFFHCMFVAEEWIWNNAKRLRKTGFQITGSMRKDAVDKVLMHILDSRIWLPWNPHMSFYLVA